MMEWGILEWAFGEGNCRTGRGCLKGWGRRAIVQGCFLGEGFQKDYVELRVIYHIYYEYDMIDVGSG